MVMIVFFVLETDLYHQLVKLALTDTMMTMKMLTANLVPTIVLIVLLVTLMNVQNVT